jgi:hypothetical protein
MADKRLTHSPRALRDSTENAEKFAKAKVQYETGSTGRVSPQNEGAEELFDQSGSAWGAQTR